MEGIQEWSERLHDGVLLDLSVGWESGTIEFVVERSAGITTLSIQGFKSLYVPRMEPWGPNVCVNEIRLLRHEPSGARRLEVEMQSGDVAVIEGAEAIVLSPGT